MKPRLTVCPPPPHAPAMRVEFAGEPDPVRTVIWLRDLIARARAAKTERQNADSGVESAA